MTELTPRQLDRAEAKRLTARIREHVETVWELIRQAYESKAWKALGYPNWAAYCDGEFSSNRIRLPQSERREVVTSLHNYGMSQRAIAAATGSDPKTIRSDLRKVGEIPSPSKGLPAGDPFWEADDLKQARFWFHVSPWLSCLYVARNVPAHCTAQEFASMARCSPELVGAHVRAWEKAANIYQLPIAPAQDYDLTEEWCYTHPFPEDVLDELEEMKAAA